MIRKNSNSSVGNNVFLSRYSTAQALTKLGVKNASANQFSSQGDCDAAHNISNNLLLTRCDTATALKKLHSRKKPS